MPFIVETGVGMPDSTSLISLEEASLHLSSTGYAEEWSDFDEDRQKELLVNATTVASNSFTFRGTLNSESQALPFGRTGLRDRENRLIVGVPPLVRMGTAELAYAMSQSNYMSDNELAALESIRVGPISLEVAASASVTKVIPDSILRLFGEYGIYRFGKLRMRTLQLG